VARNTLLGRIGDSPPNNGDHCVLSGFLSLVYLPTKSGEAGLGCGRWLPGAVAVEAMVACGRLKMRQRREGKRSAGSFEAQVYSSVNRRIYLGRATWALPCIFVGYR
jgi:hypothetical protein